MAKNILTKKEKQAIYDAKRYKCPIFREKNIIRQRKDRILKNEIAIFLMNGGCVECGYNKSRSAIEYHHIDGSTKEASPSDLINGRGWPTVYKELRKTIQLCSNHHREHHAGLLKITKKHIRLSQIPKRYAILKSWKEVKALYKKEQASLLKQEADRHHIE